MLFLASVVKQGKCRSLPNENGQLIGETSLGLMTDSGK